MAADPEGRSSKVNGRYLRVLDGILNGHPFYRHEKDPNFVLWYCREWDCHVDGWVSRNRITYKEEEIVRRQDINLPLSYRSNLADSRPKNYCELCIIISYV